MPSVLLTHRHQTNNNSLNAIQETRTQSFLNPITLENNILTVPVQSWPKATVHLPTLLLPLVPLLIVGVDQVMFNILICHLILQFSVIRSSTLTVKLDLYLVLLITLKSMDLLTPNVLLMTLQLNRLKSNAMIEQRTVKNTTLETIVFHLSQKILNNKSFPMAQWSSLSQSIEISLSTRVDCIKSTLKIKNSLLSMPSKLLVGMWLMVKTAGWLKIHGERIGERMVLHVSLLSLMNFILKDSLLLSPSITKKRKEIKNNTLKMELNKDNKQIHKAK